MNDDDVNLLHDDLHELADGIVPAASSTARDRARRGIARRTRNRRAAMGGAGAVVIIVATVFFAVDRTHDDTARPIGTTTPTVSSTPTTITPSTSSPTTTAPGSPILSTIPPVSELPAATASYAQTFSWGTNPDQVAFQVPRGEGVSGGPVAFTADAAGNIVMLDQSNSRIVRFEHGSAAADQIALASPAVTAAAFDAKGRVIVAIVRDLAVFGPDGKSEGSWAGIAHAGSTITALDVVGDRVYSVLGHGIRTPVLRDEGSGYIALRDAAPEVDTLTANMTSTMTSTYENVLTVRAGRRLYLVRSAMAFNDLRAIDLLSDGSLVFVLGPAPSGERPDEAATYVIGRIDRAGHAQYETVTASMGYLVNGPGFVINDDGIAVMGSTTAGGVTISYYPFS